MSDKQGGMSCPMGCWVAAAGIGLLTFILSLVVADKSFFAALFLGALVFILLGLLLNWLFCKSDAQTDNRAGAGVGAAGVAGAGAAAASAASAGSTTTGQAAGAETAASTDGDSRGAAASGAAAVQPTTSLTGQDDLAARKGEWRYDGEAGSGDAGASAAGDDPAGGDPAIDGEADDGASGASPSTGDADGDAGLGADGQPLVKASAPLAGEAELAARKGSWKYDGGSAAAGAGAAAAPAAKAAAAAGSAGSGAAAADGGDRDYDGDGVMEGTGEGIQPQMMDAPRDGGPDNLKEIKGIGPKLEKLCHSLGVYHFDQIAGWGPQEVAWMDANLQGFRGRVSRDDWVGQAKVLAAGGETEFSRRVDGGKVY